MIVVAAVDPGPSQSAVLLWNGTQILDASILPNADISGRFRQWAVRYAGVHCYIETMQSYGTIMGASTIQTLIWLGRFIEQWQQVFPSDVQLVTRPTIKAHICHNQKANDSHVREALIDRIGPQGTKKSNGPTYGIHTHLWAALAVGVYAYDTLQATADAPVQRACG